MASEEKEKVFETVEDMLAVPDVEYAVVDGWAGKIRIGSLTANDMIEWSEANEGPAKRTAGLRLIVKSLVDSKGSRIGQDKHIEALRAKNHKTVHNIIAAILKLNGMEVKAKTTTTTAESEAKKD